MSPEVGLRILTRVFPIVDLPHPVSPTRPKTSPLFIEKLTPSTALTYPITFLRTPPKTGKYVFKSLTSSRSFLYLPFTRISLPFSSSKFTPLLLNFLINSCLSRYKDDIAPGGLFQFLINQERPFRRQAFCT